MRSKESVWQVNIDGEIHEAELETLKQWIAEGRILPTDHVRKGALSWIPAHRAPELRGSLPDADVLLSRSARESSPLASPPAADLTEKLRAGESRQPGETSARTGASGCHNHPERSPAYVCRMCGATFCNDCPQFVGSSRIPTCPSCGDLCVPMGEANEKETKSARQATLGTPAQTVAGPATGSPFGLADFARAMRYPLKHPIGLVVMAAFYGFLQLGGFKTHLMAFAILFGCLALVIKQVAWGRLEGSFIPEFNDFSFADDILGPAFLGVGTTVVTFGPFIMLLLAMLTGWIGSPSPTATNSPEAPLESGERLTAEDLQSLINSDDPKQDETTMKKLQQLHPAAQATQYVKEHTPKSETDSLRELVNPLMNSTGMVMGLGLLTLGWAIIYYPMALAVAGYSEDFWSVINPLVGLDTIRRMGLAYVKAFFMYLGVQATGFGLGMITAVVTAPLALPLVGNLPAKIIGAVVTFYCSLVVAFILGMALHKCADQLNIPTD